MNNITFGSNYIDFITHCKTERKCVSEAIVKARYNGFLTMSEIKSKGRDLIVGDKVYFTNKNKNFAAFIIGEEYGKSGINILGAHIDSPRLDVKPNPLYEDTNIAYFDTQYYGGIKKYQWTARPLAIHGVICTMDGKTINVDIGEDETDPIFCITDLLPHLDKTQSERKASDTIKGEKLDILLGTEKLEGEEKDAVKKNILKLINDKYGCTIVEDDFESSELEIVPAGRARWCGLDKSLIAGYGQDDRVCAYTSLMAVMDLTETPKHTCGCVLVDKEEVGSICATGSESRWLEDVLFAISGCGNDRLKFASILYDTKMLSSDVTAGYDPIYADVSNKDMTCKMGAGFVLSKYNGGRGKSGGADANPEFIANVRKILTDANVKYQFDTMGKVDVGGGGTIASIVCKLNINVLDAGVPVLNMHSPMELTHRDDVYNAYLGYTAFLKN